LLQLGRLASVEMYGTCSAQAAQVVKELGANAIDYRNSDFVQEILRLTGDGVDAVFVRQQSAQQSDAVPRHNCGAIRTDFIASRSHSPDTSVKLESKIVVQRHPIDGHMSGRGRAYCRGCVSKERKDASCPLNAGIEVRFDPSGFTVNSETWAGVTLSPPNDPSKMILVPAGDQCGCPTPPPRRSTPLFTIIFSPDQSAQMV
jgi:hypothetical protein